MFRYVVFFALLCVVAALPSDMFACYAPTSAEVEGCVLPERCVLIRGQDVVVHFKFTAPRDSTSLSTAGTINMTVGGVSIPMLSVFSANTCDGLTNAQCPVRAGQELEYTLRMPVSESIPVHFLTMVRVSVTDDTGLNVFCTDIPVVVA